MSAVERLAILVEANGQGAIREFGKVGSAAERDLGKAESKADKLGARMTSAGAVMMSAAAVMAAGMWNAGQAAADLEQAVGGSEAVFKENAGAIQEWAKGADKAAGLSEEAALRLTTRLGGALKGLGYDQQAAADQSMKLTQVAADLAATYGGTTADAVQALGAAYRGEYDPAEQFNLFLKQSEVDAKAVEMGLAKSTKEVDKYARAQAVTALIMEQSADAQGQFGRELDTTAGRLAVSKAQFENMKAELGAGFLPVMTQVGSVLGWAAEGFSSLNQESGGLLAKAAGWGTVFLGAAGALSFMTGQVIQARSNLKTAAAGAVDFVKKFGLINTIKVAGAVTLIALLTKSVLGSKQAAEDAANAWGGGSGSLDQRINNVKAALAEQNEELKKFQSLDIGPLHIWAQDAGKDIANARDANKDLLKQLEQQKVAADAANAASLDLAGAQRAAADATTNHSDAAKNLNDVLRGGIDPVFAMQAATEANRKAQEDHQRALRDVWLAQLEVNAAQASGDPTRLAEATANLKQKQDELAAANTNTAKTALDVTMAATELEAKIKDQPGYLTQAKSMLDAWVASGLITADQAAVMRQKFDEAAAAALRIPSQVHSQITVAGGDEAIQKFNSLRDAINAVPLFTRVEIQGVVGTVYGPGFSPENALQLRPPGRAGGGPVSPWSVYELHDTPNAEVAEVGGSTLLFTGSQGGKVTNLGGQTAGGSPARIGGSDGRPLSIEIKLDRDVLARVVRKDVRVLDRQDS